MAIAELAGSPSKARSSFDGFMIISAEMIMKVSSARRKSAAGA